MTVEDLIEILEDMDPGAEVLIVTGQHWPFENVLNGVCVRSDIPSEDDDVDDDDDEYTDEDGYTLTEDEREKEDERDAEANGRRTDVMICVGSQLRYGNKNAWDACR